MQHRAEDVPSSRTAHLHLSPATPRIRDALEDLQRPVVGLGMARLEPSGLPMAAGLPGITGGLGVPGAALLPESATQAACVIIAWLAGWTILGAWRMMTRDA